MADEMKALRSFRSDVGSPDPATLSRISGAVATRLGSGHSGDSVASPDDESLIYVPGLLSDHTAGTNSATVAPRHRVMMAVAAALVILAGAVAINQAVDGSEGSLATETVANSPDVDPVEPTAVPHPDETSEPRRDKNGPDSAPPETRVETVEPKPKVEDTDPERPTPGPTVIDNPVPSLPDLPPVEIPPNPATTVPGAAQIPAEWAAYCEVWHGGQDHGLSPEDYIGSATHIDKMRRMAETAPSSIRAEAWVWHDFVASGGLEPVDINTNTTHLWPQEVQEAQRILMAATLNCS